ncbi:MAG: hypothetical protein U5L07_12810 [Desulfobacterales bacterium]|nr:hypothetical protein [Desulfobacterales bacterium]
MKKTIFALIVTGCLLGTAGFAAAGSSALEGYYDNYIMKKINNCYKTASVLQKCDNPRVSDLKRMQSEKAIFYTENKAQLIRSMIEKNVGSEPYKLDYFLITEFKNGKAKH